MKSRQPNSQLFNFEHRKQPLLPRKAFFQRLANSALVSAYILIAWVFIGTAGYHWLADLAWIDSLLNASMIAGGMGPVDTLHTDASKLFASLYAVMSGIVFIAVFSVIVAPILHRLLHKFHLESKE